MQLKISKPELMAEGLSGEGRVSREEEQRWRMLLKWYEMRCVPLEIAAR